MAIEVNSSNFQSEVLDKSLKTPVLIDFWAPWCGPCRTISPVLEKLEQDMGGAFILAKVNTDEEQELASQFGISGIPACKLFVNGSIKDEFTGALPEAQVRNFLEKNIPNEELQNILALYTEGKIEEAAKEVVDKKLKGPEVEEILWAEVLVLLADGKKEEAETFLNLIPDLGSKFSEHKKFLLNILKDDEKDPEAMENFLNLLKGENVKEVLEYFFSRFANASLADRDKEKEKLLACFLLLGEQEELVNVYRRKMASILFS